MAQQGTRTTAFDDSLGVSRRGNVLSVQKGTMKPKRVEAKGSTMSGDEKRCVLLAAGRACTSTAAGFVERVCLLMFEVATPTNGIVYTSTG